MPYITYLRISVIWSTRSFFSFFCRFDSTSSFWCKTHFGMFCAVRLKKCYWLKWSNLNMHQLRNECWLYLCVSLCCSVVVFVVVPWPTRNSTVDSLNPFSSYILNHFLLSPCFGIQWSACNQCYRDTFNPHTRFLDFVFCLRLLSLILLCDCFCDNVLSVEALKRGLMKASDGRRNGIE